MKLENQLLKKYNSTLYWENLIVSKKASIDLSIIVPVYNTAKYIEQCINSLISQKTNYTYEIIFVNDGSTDNSLKILKEYEKKFKIIKVLNQKNIGAGGARNLGINNSKGEYLSFVDSDDYVSELYVDTLLNIAYKENVEVVKCGYFEFNIDTNKIIKEFKYKNKIIKQENLKDYNIKGHCCMCIIHKDLFKNLSFPVGCAYEDMIMRLIIFPKAKKLAIIDNSLYYYAIRQDSSSRSKENKKNYKSLAQYFLLKLILEKREELKLQKDYYFYKNLLNELGKVMWLRTRHLDKETFKNTFLLSCGIFDNYFKSTEKEFNIIEKLYIYSLKKKKFILWQVLSLIEMAKVKLFN